VAPYRTDARGAAEVLDTASYEARVAFVPERAITAIRCEPAREALQRVVGTRASGGFRALLDAALPAERDARSLLYLLLDDLPVAALVSGYAFAYGTDFPVAENHGALRQADLCAGWRTGGTLLTGLLDDRRVPVATGPDATGLARTDDAFAWHALPPLPDDAMRRHRRLDLRLDAGELLVDAFFRDSHVAPGGHETIVHEYAVAARVDAATRTFTAIEATAGALPWIECNPAPASAARLLGQPVGSLRPRVRADFVGTTTCTHLNDVLRSLEDVEALATVLAARDVGAQSPRATR